MGNIAEKIKGLAEAKIRPQENAEKKLQEATIENLNQLDTEIKIPQEIKDVKTLINTLRTAPENDLDHEHDIQVALMEAVGVTDMTDINNEKVKWLAKELGIDITKLLDNDEEALEDNEFFEKTDLLPKKEEPKEEIKESKEIDYNISQAINILILKISDDLQNCDSPKDMQDLIYDHVKPEYDKWLAKNRSRVARIEREQKRLKKQLEEAEKNGTKPPEPGMLDGIGKLTSGLTESFTKPDEFPKGTALRELFANDEELINAQKNNKIPENIIKNKIKGYIDTNYKAIKTKFSPETRKQKIYEKLQTIPEHLQAKYKDRFKSYIEKGGTEEFEDWRNKNLQEDWTDTIANTILWIQGWFESIGADEETKEQNNPLAEEKIEAKEESDKIDLNKEINKIANKEDLWKGVKISDISATENSTVAQRQEALENETNFPDKDSLTEFVKKVLSPKASELFRTARTKGLTIATLQILIDNDKKTSIIDGKLKITDIDETHEFTDENIIQQLSVELEGTDQEKFNGKLANTTVNPTEVEGLWEDGEVGKELKPAIRSLLDLQPSTFWNYKISKTDLENLAKNIGKDEGKGFDEGNIVVEKVFHNIGKKLGKSYTANDVFIITEDGQEKNRVSDYQKKRKAIPNRFEVDGTGGYTTPDKTFTSVKAFFKWLEK